MTGFRRSSSFDRFQPWSDVNASRRIRHQRALRGADFPHDVEVPRFEGIPLDIELHVRDERVQFIHVRGPDMPLIGPGMNGYSVRPGIDADLRGPCHAGDTDGPRVPEQRYLVHVHAESGHRSRLSWMPLRRQIRQTTQVLPHLEI